MKPQHVCDADSVHSHLDLLKAGFYVSVACFSTDRIRATVAILFITVPGTGTIEFGLYTGWEYSKIQPQ